MEEGVELGDVKLSSSYEMLLVTIKGFETESVIKGYHAYMNDWTPMLAENVSIRPEPENEIDEYAVAVTTDARVIGHLKKGKTGRYAKTDFYFLELIKWTLLGLLSQGKVLTLEMDKDCKFPAQFYSREKKCILKFQKKQLNLNPL